MPRSLPPSLPPSLTLTLFCIFQVTDTSQMNDEEYVVFLANHKRKGPTVKELSDVTTRHDEHIAKVMKVPTSYCPVSACSPYVVSQAKSQHTDDRCL